MSKSDVSDGIYGFGIDLMESHTTYASGICLLVAFILLSALELRYPWRQWPLTVLRRSYTVNIGLFLFNNLVLPLFSVSTLLALAGRYSSPGWLDGLPLPTKAILSFALFDLTLYLWHWLSHRLSWLWQFHRVHHSDLTMNVSTAFRVHVLDHLTMIAFKVAYVIGFGIDKEALVWNETITTLFMIFHHSNFTFRGEKLLGNLIIVPYLHRLHHSTKRHEHDSNYGAALSIWDRLFGTLKEGQPEALGIAEPIPNDLLGLIRAGFGGGTPIPAPAIEAETLAAMVAEAAYYKAEKRNFAPGWELLDWQEAKAEILTQIYRNGNGQKPKAARGHKPVAC
jgi:sterol desaturase/sphingolipid hydroxylase (fatty acid hydroxylase superfamily)